ncbi:DNA adenine methylase [Pseudidiomarina mangrovi]|uniref:DNA adenine methylase n=1 Tax=Pseudidiomarina mangrovi TaxID=2487133 RepID=UPI000FCB5776|nr:DNA adenine methylase [Pseudidiomarina mangrovi]
MSNRSFYTPLRYPGGKGKFAHYLKELFEANELCDGHYAEPYAGGAGVAFELLFLEYASIIHINDIDPAVYSFWKTIIDQPEELVRLIYDTPVTMENWYKAKTIINANSNEVSALELGFATFFLNRTNRSGILKAGVIGGKEQAGDWKLNVRYNKKELVQRILKIANFRNRIRVSNLDAIDFLNNLDCILPEKSLVYLDPPYYVKGSGLYRNFYEHDDHVSIRERLDTFKKPWLVSYDNVPEIKSIYEQYRKDEYVLSYTAQQKKRGAEVMIYGPTLSKPIGAKLLIA